jgi:hypothetical protein
MKKRIASLFFIFACLTVTAQSTYVPGAALLNSGNSYMGIGTTAPSAKFNLQQSNGGWTDGLRITHSGKNWDIVSDISGDRLLVAQNQNVYNGFAINGGSFGVGTGTPSGKFHVYSSGNSNAAYITSINANVHWPLIITTNGKGNFSGFVSSPTSDISLLLRDNTGTIKSQINSAGVSFIDGGTFGVGTATPNGKIHVYNNGNSNAAYITSMNTNEHWPLIVTTNGKSNFSGFVSSAASNIFLMLRDNTGAVKSQINSAGVSFIDGGNFGVNTDAPTNKLQIGENPIAFNGNDLVVSNANGSLAIHNELLNGTRYAYLYGAGAIALRPGYGKWALYADATGNVAIGSNVATGSRLKIQQSSNTDWAVTIANDGGSGKGLRIQGADGSSQTPLLQIDDNHNNTHFKVLTNGNVGIGIGTADPDHKLDVNGIIHAEEVRVDMSVPGPDYVFESDYKLPTLQEIALFIQQNKHLPEVPSAQQMADEGLNLKEMNLLLLKKMEEMTLYVIDLNAKSKEQAEQIRNQAKEIELLKKKMK